MIAEIIIAYGRSEDAGVGARTYALTLESMRKVRQDAGQNLTDAIESYRRRNAYVVVGDGCIITVAFASKPLFN
jgi:hypothetical protein